MTAEAKTCGECTACCKLLQVPALEKPAGQLCRHACVGGGCGVYQSRPEACRQFECGYLQNPALGPEWRPDRAGFMIYFSEPGPRLNVVPEDPSQRPWMRPPYIGQLREWSRRDLGSVVEVLVRAGDQLTVIFPEGEVNLGTERWLPIRSGYRVENGRKTPFAEFVEDRPQVVAVDARNLKPEEKSS